jgi:hypothetical protein
MEKSNCNTKDMDLYKADRDLSKELIGRILWLKDNSCWQA